MRRAPPASLSLDGLVQPGPRTVDAAEYSPLEAPRLPFSSRPRIHSGSSSNRTSSSSLSSLASSGSRRWSGTGSAPAAGGRSGELSATRPRVELGGTSGHYSNGSSPAASVQSLPRVDEDMERYRYSNGDDDGMAQEELLDESERPARPNGDTDPYAWERPLDAVSRHSRLLDVAPVTQSVRDSRRLSRLPPGVAMVDPFGFNVAADPSPYDLALSASQAPANSSLSTSAPVPHRASYAGVPSVSAQPVASSSAGYRASFMGPPTSALDAGSAPTTHNWAKQRASSHGELGNNAYGQPRSQIRNSLLSPNAAMRATSPKPGAGPSKLSGEVDLETLPAASKRQSLAPPIPSDADYLNSRLYQRTLKAQKAVEKERAKAAAKGKMSRYDSAGPASKSTSSLSSTLGGLGLRKRSGESLRPASVMSAAGVSGSSSIRRSGRKSFGWFRSSSEVVLPLSASTSSATSNGRPDSITMPTSLSLPKMPANPTRTSSNGTSSSTGRLSPLPTMPPSPNLPSEATLKAMGVSDDQLEAAAQAQVAPAGRPRLDARSTSSDRRVSSRPPVNDHASASSTSQALNTDSARLPAALALVQTPSHESRPALSPPLPAPVQQGPPRSDSRDALAPLAENTLSSKPSRENGLDARPSPPSRDKSEKPYDVRSPEVIPPRGHVSDPPRQYEDRQRPQTTQVLPAPSVKAPAQASHPARPEPARPVEPARAVELPRKVDSGSQVHDVDSASYPSRPQQVEPQRPEYRRVASSSSSGQRTPPAPSNSLVVPSARPSDVKRRKSGFGAFFGFGGGGDKATSTDRKVSAAPSLSQSGRSTLTVTERREERQDDRQRTLRKVDERERAPAPLPQKLSRDRANSASATDETGGFFGRSKAPRASTGPNGASSSGVVAAPPPPKKKKEPEPFYHPSQMLHAAEPEPSRPAPARQRSQQTQEAIRPINPSPLITQKPSGMRSASAGNPHDGRSNGLGSSTSTFASSKERAVPASQQAPPPQKKGGLSSLFSSYGSVRSRTRSSPSAPTSSDKRAPSGHDVRTMPVLSQGQRG